MSVFSIPVSVSALPARLAPLWMLPSRLVLGVLAQLLVVSCFTVRGHPDPWTAAQPWWTVSGSLIDVGSLLLLALVARREGAALGDWLRLGNVRSTLKACLWCVPLILILGVAGGISAGLLIYGAPQPAPMGGLPLMAALYSTLVWPVLWAVSEELTYNGYLAPRLESLFGSRTQAVGFVALWWALQHIVLPMRFDGAFMLSRALSALPVAIGTSTVFLRTRQLWPLIVGHWVANTLATLTAVLWPALH